MSGGAEHRLDTPTAGVRSDAAPAGGSLLERLARCDAWGPLEVVRAIPGGSRREAVLVEREGRRLVAKTTRRSEAALAWLTDVHSEAQHAGIVVPAFLPSQGGHLVESGITLESWIDGRPADAHGMARLRGKLRAFHDATRALPQRPGFTSTTALIDAAVGGDVDLTAMPDDVVRACRAAWERMGGTPRSVIHGDLQPANILETPDGGVALVDWDEARVDVSLLDEIALSLALGARPRPGWEPAELALRAWEVACSWRLEPVYARRLAAHLPPPTDPT